MQQYLATTQWKHQSKIKRWMETNQRGTTTIITTHHKHKCKLEMKHAFSSVIENILKINYLTACTIVLKLEDRDYYWGVKVAHVPETMQKSQQKPSCPLPKPTGEGDCNYSQGSMTIVTTVKWARPLLNGRELVTDLLSVHFLTLVLCFNCAKLLSFLHDTESNQCQ